MEIIEVVALAHFADTRFGSVSRKQKLRLAPQVAEQLEGMGLVARVNPPQAPATMPLSTAPQVAGGGESLASLPAAPVSPLQTANLPSDKDGASSPSTTAGNSPEALTSSTPATGNGGELTPPESARSSKASSGRKTKKPQSATD